MLRQQEPSGPFLTRSTAAYPGDFNELLAQKLTEAVLKLRRQRQGTSTVEPSQNEESSEINPKVVMSTQLRGQHQDNVVREEYSLRNVHKWSSNRSLHVGKQVENYLEGWLEDNIKFQEDVLSSMGKPKEESQIDSSVVDELRKKVFDILSRNRSPGQPDTCDLGEIHTQDYGTVVRGHLLHYWAVAVGDPAAAVATWLFEGAPAGIALGTEALDGICPIVEDDDAIDHDDLHTDYDMFTNYVGVEDDVEALEALEAYHRRGYLAKFSSLEEVTQFLGQRPILSKLGCIKKDQYNVDTQTWSHKTRIILDCKRSLVSKAASRTHKSVLPRVSDAIQSTLQMMMDASAEQSITFFITDVEDAFWLLPLRREERRFFVARLRNVYYVFLRTAQGSRCAPLTFAAVIGLAARWVQSLVGTPPWKCKTEEARVQVYVDDPLFTIRGTVERQRRLAWMIMGFPMAFHKAVMSPKLTWIGISLQVSDNSVEVEVPEAKVAELLQLIAEVLSSNVVSKAVLRTCIGKLMAIASLLYMWRPFIQEFYVALHAQETHAPDGCVWVKQIRHSLEWVQVFLKNEAAGIRRVYTLDYYKGLGDRVVITWDASPYGLGATLRVNGVIKEFFAIPITEDDQRILQTKSGTSEGQQVWETLAGLVALRAWSKWWRTGRAVLQIRSGNVGALVLFNTLRGRSKATNLIAREYSLDLGQAQWRPDLVTHVPGIANVLCDVLSRRYDPNKEFVLPKMLTAARPIVPPPRDETWWKTLVHKPEIKKRSPTKSFADPLGSLILNKQRRSTTR